MRNTYRNFSRTCCSTNPPIAGRTCWECDDSLTNTVRVEPCNLVPENEALRRRLLEMEILSSRSNFEVPDELRVLKAENNHFRDLTYSRLAEVEYWKKMYTNERNNYAARIEALKREYEDRFEIEIKRIRAVEADRTRIDMEVNRQLDI